MKVDQFGSVSFLLKKMFQRSYDTKIGFPKSVLIKVKWSASSWWLSSLFQSNEITIGKTDPTLNILIRKPINIVIIAAH